MMLIMKFCTIVMRQSIKLRRKITFVFENEKGKCKQNNNFFNILELTLKQLMINWSYQLIQMMRELV